MLRGPGFLHAHLPSVVLDKVSRLRGSGDWSMLRGPGFLQVHLPPVVLDELLERDEDTLLDELLDQNRVAREALDGLAKYAGLGLFLATGLLMAWK